MPRSILSQSDNARGRQRHRCARTAFSAGAARTGDSTRRIGFGSPSGAQDESPGQRPTASFGVVAVDAV